MKKNLVFLVSQNCQHKCVYCIRDESDKKRLFLDDFLNTEFETIKKHLNLYKKYVNEITLTGGEPLLNKELIKICDYAINNGIELINIHSNGAALGGSAIFDYLNKIKEKIRLIISLPSIDENVFNKITQTKNFKKVTNNIKKYIELDFDLRVNIVVSSLNIETTIDTVKYLSKLGVRNIQFLGIDTYTHDYNIEYTQSLPVLNKVIGKYKDKVNFKIYAMPKCLIEKYEHLNNVYEVKTNRATYNEFTIGSGNLLLKTDYLKISRTKIPVCQKCSYNDNCEGIFRSYIKVYGEKEF